MKENACHYLIGRCKMTLIRTRGKFAKTLIVLLGIILGQAILYGPSLIGQKFLLPLDLLANPGVYTPQTAASATAPHDVSYADAILYYEPSRQFAISEFRHGRFPLWAPYIFAGIPFLGPRFSIFLLLEYCVKSPVVLAWVQLLAALVGGAGMYYFCRRVLRVGFWPATAGAWCYPLTAFFILWQGAPMELPVYWLPWLFLAVDWIVRADGFLPVMGLSVITALVLTSGAIDVAGQVLLGSLVFAVRCCGILCAGGRFWEKCRTVAVKLFLGWALGFLLASPYILPLLEYAHTGSRMERRSAGTEERPPVGLSALPQVALPDIYGSTAHGSYFISNKEASLIESPSAAYAGVIALLLVAPLAWCDRRRLEANMFWLFLAFLGAAWCLNVPGVVSVFRLPVLNMMSYNRLVFLTSFAILCLTAVGLENLLTGAVQRRRWFWVPALLLAGLCGWCFYRRVVLPEPVATQLAYSISHGVTLPWGPTDLKGTQAVKSWFILHYTVMGIFCGLGFVGWLLVWSQTERAGRWFPALLILLLADLLWFGHDRSSQCDPALYYPKIPVLENMAQSTSGRFMGAGCLPPCVTAGQDACDVRGYDAVDPARMVALVKSTAIPARVEAPYAATQWLAPAGDFVPPDSVRLSPILDMLNVRYVVFCGVPPPYLHPKFESPGYWVLVNSNALPRAFVPKSLENISDSRSEFEKLSAPDFNPRAIAYVESQLKLPESPRGTAQITNETPTHVTIGVHMETPGLVVLADRWDTGWQAYYNGKPTPILRTNYAIRGVLVPAGDGVVEYVYRPKSLILGLSLAALAATILLLWPGVLWLKQSKGVWPHVSSSEMRHAGTPPASLLIKSP